MFQSFSTELAEKIGLQEAVIVGVLAYRIMEIKHTGKPVGSLYRGEYWETSGILAIAEQFPYIPFGSLMESIRALLVDDVLKYMESPVQSESAPYWYTFTDKGWQMLKDYRII